MAKFSFEALQQRRWILRLDIFPFIPPYVLLMLKLLISTEEESVYPKLIWIIVVLLHGLTYLTGFWSVYWRRRICYSGLSLFDINKASDVFVTFIDKQNTTNYAICDLKKQEIDHQIIQYIMVYGRKFIYDQESHNFKRLKPNVKNLTYDECFHPVNLKDTYLYEKNSLDIPMTPFSELLRDQLMEPTSFFQIFSVSLWLLDEGRIYPIMTLMMLVLAAGTVAMQRVKTWLVLRKMRVIPQQIYTYRNDCWIKLDSRDLVPGDICLVQSGHRIQPVSTSSEKTDEEILMDYIPFAKKLPPAFFKTQTTTSNESFKGLPCDFVLLAGNCIVNESALTGESVPQIKDPIRPQNIYKQAFYDEMTQNQEVIMDKNSENNHQETTPLNMEKNKEIDDQKMSEGAENQRINLKEQQKHAVLYCGTTILQAFIDEKLPSSLNQPPIPLSECCLARVLKTGFDTSKGKLIRTVLFYNENVKLQEIDALLIIGTLLVFALASSLYVLKTGLGDEERNKNKLFLRCILIITSVVPSELPMILAMAVNRSLLALQKLKIFCSEPFRIPVAGKSSIIAFDKTGTLTADKLAWRGIVNNLNQYEQLSGKIESSLDSQCILVGCHSLLVLDNELIGDPMEQLIFESSPWIYLQHDKSAICKTLDAKCQILKTFPFASDLRRMSTYAIWHHGSNKQYRALVKGAPETIQELLKKLPENYIAAYTHHSRLGFRVLALGWKQFEYNDDLDSLQRKDLESDLEFGGFLICESPLKIDTKKQIDKLQQAEYRIMIITGDNHLTAIGVARQLNLGPQDVLIIDQSNEDLVAMNETGVIFAEKVNNLDKLKDLSKTHTLVMTGSILAFLQQQYHHHEKYIAGLLSQILIYARTSPSQKEFIIQALRKNGNYILMCGDGTNDMGALKKADIGVALVGLIERTPETKKAQKEKERKRLEAIQKNPKLLLQNNAGNPLFDDDEEQVKLGDACIAAPFTSKHSSSIKCVYTILRQGVCTLSSSLSTYKILTLTSLLNAYTLSALHMQALKFSDLQYTVLGISSTYAFFQFSNAKPQKKIYKTRPASSIVNRYFLISLLIQSILQIYGTDKSVRIGMKYSSSEDLKLTHDEEFKPTFINTTVFLFQLLSNMCIFLFNNGGEPYMQGFREQRSYLKMLVFFTIASLILAMNVFSDYNAQLGLTFEHIPYEANIELVWLFIQVFGLTYITETILKYM